MTLVVYVPGLSVEGCVSKANLVPSGRSPALVMESFGSNVLPLSTVRSWPSGLSASACVRTTTFTGTFSVDPSG